MSLRPREAGDWDVRFASNEAAKGWEELCRQAPGNSLAAWMLMRRNPAPAVRGPRHHRLRDGLATRTLRGRVLDRWRIEVTGATRVWYLVDAESRTVWVDHAGPGHPQATGLRRRAVPAGWNLYPQGHEW